MVGRFNYNVGQLQNLRFPVLLSSAQFKMVSIRPGKPICVPPRLSEVSSNVAFETVVPGPQTVGERQKAANFGG